MKMLVGIVNFGRKNDAYLRLVIDGYRSMPWHTDIVVLTNENKKVPAGVELKRVAIPDEPKHFPMHLRHLLYERREDYDLYAGTEDDVLLLPIHAKAFLECSEVMGSSDVPGFIRFEIGPNHVSVHDMHAHFWWNLDSVQRFGPWVMAQPTNLHSAAYLLTRDHLDTAVASNRFLNTPVKTRDYGLLEGATTQLYTHCGLRKWIPVSRIDDFLLHHIPNKYLNHLGTPLTDVLCHANAISDLESGTLDACTLLPESEESTPRNFLPVRFGEIREDLVSQIPIAAKTILWVGSTHGLTEKRLQELGFTITCLPIDNVHAASLNDVGLKVLYPSTDAISGLQFDVVFLPEIISKISDPLVLLEKVIASVATGGTIVASELLANPCFSKRSHSLETITIFLKKAGFDVKTHFMNRDRSLKMRIKKFIKGDVDRIVISSKLRNPRKSSVPFIKGLFGH